MSPNAIREVLNAVPFIPFRLVMSDGGTHDVDDRQMVIVGNRFVHLGIPAVMGEQIADRVIRLDPLHITQLVPLSLPPAARGGNGQHL